MASHLGLHCFFMPHLCNKRFKIFDITHFVRTMKCLQIKAIHREEITSLIRLLVAFLTYSSLNLILYWVFQSNPCL